MRKVFIDVVVHNTKDGDLIPLVIIWEDGRRYGVDKVLDIRMAAASKVGGCGIRYKCSIQGKTTYIWSEEGKWFVEAK